MIKCHARTNSRDNKPNRKWHDNGVTRNVSNKIFESRVKIETRKSWDGKTPWQTPALAVFLFNECKVKRDVAGVWW